MALPRQGVQGFGFLVACGRQKIRTYTDGIPKLNLSVLPGCMQLGRLGAFAAARSCKRGVCAWPQAPPVLARISDSCGLPKWEASRIRQHHILQSQLGEVCESGVWEAPGEMGYRVLGHMGVSKTVFFKALNTARGECAVLKFVIHEEGKVAAEEAYLHASACPHKNIVPILDAFATPFTLVIAMPLADSSLRHFLAQKPPEWRSSSGTLAVVLEVTQGLSHLHKHCIVHGALHSASALVKDDHVLLADFSCAVVVQGSGSCQPELTRGRRQCWSRAPEIWFAVMVMPQGWIPGTSVQCGLPVDVWSLGCLALEVVTGQPPFEASCEQEVVRKILATCGPIEPCLAAQWCCSTTTVQTMAFPRDSGVGLSDLVRECALVLDPARRSSAVAFEARIASMLEKTTAVSLVKVSLVGSAFARGFRIVCAGLACACLVLVRSLFGWCQSRGFWVSA